jgi:hypothetical protein
MHNFEEISENIANGTSSILADLKAALEKTKTVEYHLRKELVLLDIKYKISNLEKVNSRVSTTDFYTPISNEENAPVKKKARIAGNPGSPAPPPALREV